jgi:plasmid stability protein
MKVLTVRLPDTIEKKIRLKARLQHRTISEQIKKYLCDAIVSDDNPDLPMSFINETIEAKSEIKEGFGQEYKFGII